MKKLAALISSVIRDGTITGYGPYIRYRLGPTLRRTAPMQVTIGGQTIWVRPGTPDLRVAFQSLRSELDILSDLLPSDFDGLVIDAGGYIGTAALKLAEMYPQATVVTIEASSRNFEILQSNIAGVANIVPVNAALHAEAGLSLNLVDRGTGTWGFSVAVGAAAGGSLETVATVTLQQIEQRYPGKRLGIVKMDIEGGEHVLFRTGDAALESALALFVELHDRIVPGCTDLFRAYSADRWLLHAGGEKFLSLRRHPIPAAVR